MEKGKENDFKKLISLPLNLKVELEAQAKLENHGNLNAMIRNVVLDNYKRYKETKGGQ